MKTAVSIPNELFVKVDRLARAQHMSRSALISTAIAQYLESRDTEQITAQLNRVHALEAIPLDPVMERLQWLSLPADDWE